MKKLLLIFVSMFITMFIGMNASDAASPIKTYYTYTVVGHDLEEISAYFENALNGDRDVKKLTGTPNAYYATYGEEHYYMKLYPANKNTDIYIVSDASYDKDDNELTKAFERNNLKYRRLEDSNALREYKNDFIEHARTGALEGLFIMPDYIKPLKTGMGKLNDKISKNSKKTSAIPYSEDNDPINLDCINTTTYNNPEAQISITVKEYRLKNKQNKYVHGFEYIVKNNANTDVMVDKVTSERVASMKDITTQTFVDLDRLDLADTVGSFPPVAICTCGASLAFTVANNVRLAKVAKESLRFAHTLPENYNLKANSKMRILVMKFKNDPKPLDFSVTRNGEKFNFSF